MRIAPGEPRTQIVTWVAGEGPVPVKCHRKNRLALFGAKLVEAEPEQSITTHVTVTIPRGPLALQTFFSEFGSLSQSAASPVFDDVTFKTIAIVSADGELEISNLKATKANLATAHKPIFGTFTITERLSLITSNASIDANVTLINDATQDRPTFLELVTKHAPITAVANLVSVSPSGLSDIWDESEKNGSFRITAISSYAPVDVTVASQPVESTLTLNAVTTHGDVSVVVPPAYEGRFTLVTNPGGQSSVVEKDDTPDPEGKGRKRFVDVKRLFGGIATGNVKWVAADADDALVKEHMEWEAEFVDTLGPEAGWAPPPHVELITSQGDNHLFLS